MAALPSFVDAVFSGSRANLTSFSIWYRILVSKICVFSRTMRVSIIESTRSPDAFPRFGRSGALNGWMGGEREARE
jgi:hypothetical protein